uniref:FAR-17a/AIG1-like protein n=1 Tax=Arcella intermedia TaxID=1963864 RepID=A0A6B2LM28_9EUKA
MTMLGHLLHTLFSMTLVLRFFWPNLVGVERFFVVVFAMSTAIGILFWAIFFYDRELILPKSLDAIYPMSLNVFQHGFIAILMWVEYYLGKYPFTSTHFRSFINFSIGYTIWTHVQKALFGIYPYPFMEFLDPVGHIVFITPIFSVLGVIYFILLGVEKKSKLKSN